MFVDLSKTAIVRRPMITYCQHGPVRTDQNGQAQFMCHLSNYSEYVEAVVVKDNRTVYNISTEEIGFTCWPNHPVNPGSPLGTCTVNISTSLHSGSLQYKVCVGLNASVEHRTGFHCSGDIAVLITQSSSKL